MNNGTEIILDMFSLLCLGANNYIITNIEATSRPNI